MDTSGKPKMDEISSADPDLGFVVFFDRLPGSRKSFFPDPESNADFLRLRGNISLGGIWGNMFFILK